MFCSEKCRKEYRKKNETLCFNCKKTFLKNSGVFSSDKWFCSIECEPKIEQLYEEWKKKNIKPAPNQKSSNKLPLQEYDIDLGLEDYEEKPLKIKNLEELEN